MGNTREKYLESLDFGYISTKNFEDNFCTQV